MFGSIKIGGSRNSWNRYSCCGDREISRKGDGFCDNGNALDRSSHRGSAIVDPARGESRLNVQRCAECSAIRLLFDVIDKSLTRSAGGGRRLDEIYCRCH